MVVSIHDSKCSRETSSARARRTVTPPAVRKSTEVRRALAPGVPEPASAACPGGNIGVQAALRVAADEKREEEVPRTLSAFGRSDRLVKPPCMVS